MAKIFVTQERDFDFSPAETFGELVFVTDQDFWNIDKSQHNARLIDNIADAFKDYDPVADYIIAAGSVIVMAATFLILGKRGHRKVRMLRWSNRDRCYEPVILDINV
jgi:hypothetical protein